MDQSDLRLLQLGPNSTHDMAWDKLHAGLRKRVPSLKPGDRVGGNSIFRHDTVRAMVNVHLYFAKAFVCTLVMQSAQNGTVRISVMAVLLSRRLKRKVTMVDRRRVGARCRRSSSGFLRHLTRRSLALDLISPSPAGRVCLEK
jgi:hypothetical protein